MVNYLRSSQHNKSKINTMSKRENTLFSYYISNVYISMYY